MVEIKKVLDFENVSFSYPGGAQVLNNMSFHISPGEQVGLVGANGAGKSTLMKAALGLIQTQGTITVADLEMNKENLSHIRQHIGFVLQDSDNQMFMPTVLEDMIFGPLNYGMTREQAEEKAIETLKSLDMEYLKDKHNHKISGGEKRMAAIATILAMDPYIILMDEPSAALDPKNRRSIINTLNKLTMTKVIASHDLDMILETCDRVLLINHGQIVADGKTTDILTNKELLESNNLELPFCMAGIPHR